MILGAAADGPGAVLLDILVVLVAAKVTAEVAERLREDGVNVWVSRPGHPRLDGAPGDVVRASVHYYNTEDELDRLCDLLARD